MQVSDKLASDHEYAQRVRDVDADTPSRLMLMNAVYLKLLAAQGNWLYLPFV
ncbi:hypothetical protein MASR2M36_35230 [Providencia sp.]